MLIFVSTITLSRDVQRKLAEYVRNGGILCLLGEMPQYDENFHACATLQNAFPDLSMKLQGPNACIGDVVCVLRNSKEIRGQFLYHEGNPFEAQRRPRTYLLRVIARLVSYLRMKLPKHPLFDGRVLPYSEIEGLLGGNQTVPHIDRLPLKSLHLLMRFLQMKGFHRQYDLSVRTEYLFRHKIDVFVLSHPTQNILHVFIFNLQLARNLPVSVHIYHPERTFTVRLRVNLVGNTAMLARIKEGELTGLVYTGINPVSHLHSPLQLKVNRQTVTTTRPVDLVMLSDEQGTEIFTGNAFTKKPVVLEGLTGSPVVTLQRNARVYIPAPRKA